MVRDPFGCRVLEIGTFFTRHQVPLMSLVALLYFQRSTNGVATSPVHIRVQTVHLSRSGPLFRVGVLV